MSAQGRVPPRLVLGLGGALAGDDAIGLVLAERLAADRRLPSDVEVRAAGADLLRLDTALAGRTHVILVDAVAALPGETRPLVGRHPLPGLDARHAHAHHLSAVQSLELLLLTQPTLAATRFTWVLVPVTAIAPGDELSPELRARTPALLQALLQLL